MPKKTSTGQLNLLEAKSSTAPCVPALRVAVGVWRDKGYPGVTATTRVLLNWWFRQDHRLPNGRKFEYHYAQREAIETIIYLFEVVKARRQKDLIEKFANRSDLKLLQHDDFARYCIKMATGSGKTKVISLVIVWQYMNACVENLPEYAQTFLILAPNVIVFERLRSDFASGRIFRVDPLIPRELQIYWDFDCYLRGEGERAHSTGALYLTNVQQLYERPDRSTKDEPDVMTAVLGPKPQSEKMERENFEERIASRGNSCMVINDEAHHTHDEESEWNKTIRQLHSSLHQAGFLQLDVTATPRHSKGTLFAWTVYDYPLKQAIIDNIVKRPMKGVTKDIQEINSEHASIRYQAYLTAGVARWKEYHSELAPLKKKPILFIMMNDTSEADDVAVWLREKYPAEFGGQGLLVIHTDRSGEISRKDLDEARKTAREVDNDSSPVNCIVSVLMLREGWDVQNVTVIIGLRPYSSKANILPEQTIGRGLRLMFRDMGHSYTERVDVIGNKGFLEFVDALEKEEELQLETFEVGKDKLVICSIMPDPQKLDRDILIPSLSPLLMRKKSLAEDIASLDVSTFITTPLPKKENDEAAKKFRYEGYDILTLEKTIERQYELPPMQTSQEVISYYARRIAQDVKLPSQFAALVPKVREFLETKAFGEPVSLDTPAMIRAIASNVCCHITLKEFALALRPLLVVELEPQIINDGRKLSETQPFPHSRQTFTASKTVFNLCACGNKFELEFGKFLQEAPEVVSFAKLPSQFGFHIEYTDSAANLRFYEPDFVAALENGSYLLIETKGREDIDVAHKDRAAYLWCENVTLLTGVVWEYLKVKQDDYEKLLPTTVEDLIVFKYRA